MRRRRLRTATFIAVPLVAGLGAAAPASAGMISFALTGTVFEVDTGSPFGPVAPAGVVAGAPVTVTYSYDTAMAGTPIADGVSYPLTASNFSFSASIAGNQWVADGGSLALTLDPSSQASTYSLSLDQFSSFADPPTLPPPLEGIPTAEFGFVDFASSTPGFLPGLQPPALPLDLGLADNALGQISGNACSCSGPGPRPESYYEIFYDIDSMTEAATVPEPATLFMFGTMLLGLGAVRRFRRSGF